MLPDSPVCRPAYAMYRPRGGTESLRTLSRQGTSLCVQPNAQIFQLTPAFYHACRPSSPPLVTSTLCAVAAQSTGMASKIGNEPGFVAKVLVAPRVAPHPFTPPATTQRLDRSSSLLTQRLNVSSCSRRRYPCSRISRRK